MSQEITEFLDRHVREVKPLLRETNLSSWELNVSGSEEAMRRNQECEIRLRRTYSRTAEFEQVRRYRETAPADPLTRRQVDRLYLAYLGNQVAPERIDAMVALEKQLEAGFNTHRARVGGKEVSDNEVKRILREENDNGRRREAWEASKQVGGKIAGGLRELVRMRNAEARRLGFRDHFAMALELQELDEAWMFETFAKLVKLSEEPWRRFKSGLDARLAQRFGVAVAELRPWHFVDPFFQEPPSDDFSLDGYFEGRSLESLAKAFFGGLGFEIDDILERSDLYERAQKCQHAFCMDVDREGDIRMLCNLKSNESWMDTLLHELGHAIYDKYHDPGLPFLLREPAHTLSTEAIAILMGRFTKNAAFLDQVVGVPRAEAEGAGAKLRAKTAEELMIFTRWVMVMTHFERDLYGNPEQDLNQLWWDHVERYQNVQRPEGERSTDWAAKIHLTVAPVYYQNYLLGAMMASQLSAHLRTRVLKSDLPGLSSIVGRKEAGEFLEREVFRVGARLPWNEALRQATGEDLEPKYFVAEFSA